MKAKAAKTTEEKKENNTDESLTLISGVFTPADARDVVLCLLDSKINYHELSKFSQMVKTGRSDAHTEVRLTNLRSDREKLIDLVKEAEKKGLQLHIRSEINISVEK